MGLINLVKKTDELLKFFKKIDDLNSFADSMSAKDALAAYEAAKEALELANEYDYLKGKVHSLFYLGESLYRQGKIIDAMERLEKSLSLNDDLSDLLIQSRAHTTLGNIHLYLKLYDLAYYYFQSALIICEELNRFEPQAMILNNIGELYRELGDHKKALKSYEQCINISEKNNFVRVSMYAIANIGVSNYETKDYNSAFKNLNKSLTISKQINNQIIEGFSTRYLGLIHLEKQEFNQAEEYFNKALKVYQKSNETISQARLYKDLSQLNFNKGNYDQAIINLNTALKLLDNLQDYRLFIIIYDLFVEIYEALKDYQKACEYNNLSLKARKVKEQKEKQHLLLSLNYQVQGWDAIKESSKYQEINQQLQEKTEKLEKATKELQKINKEVREISNIDGLTKIANRVKLDDFAQDVCSRAYKNKAKLTMMIIDIDNFKEYNDFYGHLVGDEALKKLARILEKSIQNKEGIVARFGGDEFVAVVYNCDLKVAKEIAKSISKSLAVKKIKHEKSQVNPYLTVSIGIYTDTPKKKSTYSLLMDFADQALYQAKQKGKNQIEVFEI
jgi:diguanylate cyclase (GGDEF)-like protein